MFYLIIKMKIVKFVSVLRHWDVELIHLETDSTRSLTRMIEERSSFWAKNKQKYYVKDEYLVARIGYPVSIVT